MNFEQRACGHDNRLSSLELKQQIIRAFFISNCIILLLVGLWPFSFWTDNEVRRLNQVVGIEFYNRGIVFSGSSLNNKTIRPPTETIDAVSIEIWLKPHEEPDNRTLAFLCFNDEKLPPPIVLGQWKSSLMFHTRNEGGKYPKKFEKIRLRNCLLKGEKRLLTVTSGLKGTAIYLDGKRTGFYPNRKLLNTKSRFLISCLVLGNDPTGKKPWKGKIFGLSIYDQKLSGRVVFQNFQYWIHEDFSKLSRQDGIIALYSMDEPNGQWLYNRLDDSYHLWIPERFQVPKPLILNPPWKDKGFEKFMDIAINLLGFIPFGLLGLAYFSSTRKSSNQSARLFLIVILLGGLLSLAIELFQVYLPPMYSSLTDLICNILGIAVGAYLYHLVIRKLAPLNRARAVTG